MSLIGDLRKPNFKITKSDKIILKYVQENLEKIPYIQISHMAKEIGIGEATVTRFVKKIGCKGFQDFKVGIAQEISMKSQNSIINSSIESDESAIKTAEKLAATNIKTIEENLRLVDNELIEDVSSRILNARKVYFIGVGFSGITALDANYKFMRIGIDSSYFDSTHTMLMMASIMKKGDLVVAISHTGNTTDIINTSVIAKKGGADIVGITGNLNSKITEVSDVTVPYFSIETVLETGSLNSKLAQHFIIDLLYTEVVKMSLVESTSNKLRTTDAIRIANKELEAGDLF